MHINYLYLQSMEFSRPENWSGQPFPSPQGNLPDPGIKSRSPALQADSLSADPQGKSRNSGVGSLSVLQWVFPTLESNQGLLHCRWILYQLSYQGRRCLTKGNGLFPSDVLDNVDEFLHTDWVFIQKRNFTMKENDNLHLFPM